MVEQSPQNAVARRGTPYRLAADVANSDRSPDLEELLRSRLRVATALAAVTAAVLGVATLASNLERIRGDVWTAFTVPPFGAPMLAMAGYMVWTWRSLAAVRHPELAKLNRVSTVLLAVWAAYFVIIVTGDFSILLGDVARIPIDLAMAHSSMWGLLLVATGVLIPSTRQTGTRRIALLASCALIPDVLVLGSADVWPPNTAVYVVTKAVMVSLYAAFAAYGGNRIEALRRDAQAARQLGQYVLTAPLGSGGMGEVHLAEHRLLKRPCAIKIIREDQAGDEATLRRFEREAQATARLTHPSTVQVFDYGITDDRTFYYVMEFLNGENLDALLAREGPQPIRRVAHILSQLCGALQEAHDVGLVHRDIKPANVMLCNRGGVRDVAKLLDFGLVASVHAVREAHPDGAQAFGGDGRLTEAGNILGTPAYMSPEQCGGEAGIGPASDIYSLGAVAFALVTGKSPFAGRGPMQMIAAHLLEPPPRADATNPAVPAVIGSVIARALAKSPSDRFPTIAQFGEAFAGQAMGSA
jgi:tRNA A-37 threonylcarbamoyl transferase component Bud32